MTRPGARFFVAHVSHPGAVRPVNEDSFVARSDEGFWLVADGMGGLDDGRWASRTLAHALAKTPLYGDLARDASGAADAVHHANYLIFKESTVKRNRIGSTVVTLSVVGSRFAVHWAGDSRAYLVRRGVLAPLTRDHTQVRRMHDSGYLSDDEAAHHPMAHVLARAVGVQATVELEQVAGEAEVGDIFLLCSDGLTTVLNDSEIGAALHGDPAAMVQRLLDLALANGAPDNVTIVAVGCGPEIDVGEAPAGPPLLGGAAAEPEEAQAREVSAIDFTPIAAPAQRGGGAMIAVALLALLVLGGGAAFLFTRGHGGSSASASTSATPSGQALAEAKARQVFETALGGVGCSWPQLRKVSAGPNGLEVALSGVAASPAAVQSALAQAASVAKLPVADIDLQAVSPAPAVLCPTLDALRPFRAATSEGGQNLTAAQDAFAVMKQTDGSEAGRAIVALNLPPAGVNFALVQIGAAGNLKVLAASRDAFNGIATTGAVASKLPGMDAYRLQADYPQTGWSGLILLTGKGPFPPALLAPPASTPAWANQFAAAARASGWRVEMAWYQIVPGGSLSMQIAAPPTPTLTPPSGASAATSAAALAVKPTKPAASSAPPSGTPPVSTAEPDERPEGT